jgi:hypothetical protein
MDAGVREENLKRESEIQLRHNSEKKSRYFNVSICSS